jgi:hypothetical protein
MPIASFEFLVLLILWAAFIADIISSKAAQAFVQSHLTAAAEAAAAKGLGNNVTSAISTLNEVRDKRKRAAERCCRVERKFILQTNLD